MRITDVRVVVHERRTITNAPPLPPDGRMPMGVLRILTDEGIEGNAFVSGPGPAGDVLCANLVRLLKPVLLGRDPLDIGAIWADMWKRRAFANVMAIGAVDVALWDLAGKVAGLPVHRLLGTCRTKVPAYVSSWVHRTPHDYAAEVAHYRAEGWPGYKLHPLTQRRMFGLEPGMDVGVDIDTCALVREAAGDDMLLMLDSAWAYTYAEALRVGRAIEDLGYHWYEDPIGAHDIDGYRNLKQHLRIPIVATEVTEGSLHAMPAWLAHPRATDVLRGDVILKGGITPLVKIAHLADAFQVNCEVHDGFNALGNAACLNVVMAITNCEMFEVITINEPGTYGIDHLSYGLAEPIEFDDDRNVLAPTRPGLGYTIDWDLINASVVEELA